MDFIRACKNNDLTLAKTFPIPDQQELNQVFINVCECGNLEVAQWLHSQGANISAQNDRAIINSCYKGHINIVEWLIDIHYKYGGYIKFDKYTYFSDDIQNLLIDNNLIDPSTLSREDLKYYLVRTDNFVPQDFTTPHEGFTVKYRGKHTKPALRE